MSKYGRQQISQWDFPPTNAFVHHEYVDTGLSQATCKFVFMDMDSKEYVPWDASEELKEKLRSGDLS